MCDWQAKDRKPGKTKSSKPQQSKHHHQAHGRQHYQHRSDDNESITTQSTTEENIFTDPYPNHRRKTHPPHPHHHRQKPTNHHHVSLSETSLISSTISSSSSTSLSSSCSSSSSSSSSTSSSSSSFSSSSTSSSCSSSRRNSLKKPIHSQSCTDVSGKHWHFEEDDDTESLIHRSHTHRSASKGKPKKGQSSHNEPVYGTLTSAQIPSKDGNVRKARSMEALTVKDDQGLRTESQDEQDRRKCEARKNLMKEKVKFSAFLNEITRQVLSPMRLTTLGVTDAQRPCSPARSRKVDGSIETPRQQGSRRSSNDSASSATHSYSSKHSHSTQISQSKSFQNTSCHSTNTPNQRPKSCSDISCSKGCNSVSQRSHSPTCKDPHHHHPREHHISAHHPHHYGDRRSKSPHHDSRAASPCHYHHGNHSCVHQHGDHHEHKHHHHKDQCNLTPLHGQHHHGNHHGHSKCPYGEHNDDPSPGEHTFSHHQGKAHHHNQGAHQIEVHQDRRGDHHTQTHQHRHRANRTKPHHSSGNCHSECHHHHHCGNQQNTSLQYHHENHHNEPQQHQHHRDQHTSGSYHHCVTHKNLGYPHPQKDDKVSDILDHKEHCSDLHRESLLDHHGDHHSKSHPHHHRDTHGESHPHHHVDHHKESHHHGDHNSKTHPYRHGDHNSKTHPHHHGEHPSETHHHHHHGDHHSETHPHHHGDHHSETHPHHHGDHHSETHPHQHGDHKNESHPHHHGDQHTKSHPHHHGDLHSETHPHHHGYHHSESHPHHHGDHPSKVHPHHHGEPHRDTQHLHHHADPHSETHHHHHPHGDHHNKSHSYHNEDHQSESHPHNHGDNHNKTDHHHHGDHHGEDHHHGDYYSEGHHRHHGDPHIETHHHHHGDKNTDVQPPSYEDHTSKIIPHHPNDEKPSKAYPHQHGDNEVTEHQQKVNHRRIHEHHKDGHHDESHQNPYGDPHNETLKIQDLLNSRDPNHEVPEHFQDHYSPGDSLPHCDHHNEGHQYHHNNGDPKNTDHEQLHKDNHYPSHQHHHHGDPHIESQQNCQGEQVHPYHQHHQGMYQNTNDPEQQQLESHHNQSKHSTFNHEGREDHLDHSKSHPDGRPLPFIKPQPLYIKPNSPWGNSGPCIQEEEQTSFTTASLRKETGHEFGHIMVLQEQNEGLHQCLMKTAVRMEFLGEEFIGSQKLLEAELQRTRLELCTLTERFKRLHDDCSSSQQTNNLLEKTLQSVSLSMEEERERLHQRISELTEKLSNANFTKSTQAFNVTSALHQSTFQFQVGDAVDDIIHQVVLPIAPPPAQFMDSHTHENTKAPAQELHSLGSVPEEEESDWSEMGEDIPQFILTGSNRCAVWGHQDRDLDRDSESGGEEMVRRPSPCPMQIPCVQFKIHRDMLPPPHPAACNLSFRNMSDSLTRDGNYKISTSPAFDSTILIRSASLEEISLAGHHMSNELKGTEAMMDLHHPADLLTLDSDNEIIHHWRTDDDAVIKMQMGGGAVEADCSLSSLQSAEQMLKHFMSDMKSSEGSSEVHGWRRGIPEEVLKGERTTL